MANKYLAVGTSGMQEEVEGLQSSAGAGDAGKIPALDSTGRFSTTMMPVGIGADVKSIEAGEDLAGGDFVNLYDDTGLKCRKADASDSGKQADGFVLAAATTGNNATVYFEGINTQLSGLTAGSKYFLSATSAGEPDTAIPSTTNHIVQFLGKAISATEISFEPGEPMKRA